MGCYIEPEDGDKVAWLLENAEKFGTDRIAPEPERVDQFGDDLRPVCLIDNGMFYAAGIAYNDRELEAFTYPDPRRKFWFWVKLDKLKTVSNVEHYLAELGG